MQEKFIDSKDFILYQETLADGERLKHPEYYGIERNFNSFNINEFAAIGWHDPFPDLLSEEKPKKKSAKVPKEKEKEFSEVRKIEPKSKTVTLNSDDEFQENTFDTER